MSVCSVVIPLSSNAAEITLAETFSTDYITKSGSQIGTGPVSQTLFKAGHAGWYGCVWNNYDFQMGKTTETDLSIGKIFQTENHYGKFFFDLSYQYWLEEKAFEHVLEVAIKHQGTVNTSVVWTKLITDGPDFDRNRFYLELSKPLVVNSFLITPSVSTAYLDNFFGSRGLAHVTVRLKGEYQINKNLSVFLQVNGQKGIIKKDLLYGGTGLKWIF